jgi:hypothetical protein
MLVVRGLQRFTRFRILFSLSSRARVLAIRAAGASTRRSALIGIHFKEHSHAAA